MWGRDCPLCRRAQGTVGRCSSTGVGAEDPQKEPKSPTEMAAHTVPCGRRKMEAASPRPAQDWEPHHTAVPHHTPVTLPLSQRLLRHRCAPAPSPPAPSRAGHTDLH